MAERSGDGPAAGYLVVGTVRKPHGVRGELQVTVDTDRPRAVFRTGRTLALGDSRGRPTGREVTIRKTRPFKGGMIVQLDGVDDRDAADAMRGTTFLIPTDEAAPFEADEVPYHLLLGSDVLVGEERIGKVRDILEIGGGEMLVIARPGAPEAMVPFVKEIVVELDPRGRRVVIDPPEGLLEL